MDSSIAGPLLIVALEVFDTTRRNVIRLQTLKGGPAQENLECNTSEWIPLLRALIDCSD